MSYVLVLCVVWRTAEGGYVAQYGLDYRRTLEGMINIVRRKTCLFTMEIQPRLEGKSRNVQLSLAVCTSVRAKVRTCTLVLLMTLATSALYVAENARR